MQDISPELLEKLQEEFKKKFNSNKNIKKLNELILSKKVTFTEANEFAFELGNILAEVFKSNLSSEILPDGRMYFNIAKKVIEPQIYQNYELISAYSSDVQNMLNKNSGLGIKAIRPPVNQDRIDGIIKRVSDEEEFDKIKWILNEPIKNFSQSVVDETIKANAEFQYKAGLKPKIIRKEFGKCCEWCREVVGTYEYPKVPKDVYKRHRYCRCSVEYIEAGKSQNVWTKNIYQGKTEEELRQFRIRQIRDIIKRKEEKDRKEASKTQRILKNFLLGKEVNDIKIKDVSFHFAEKVIKRSLKADDIIETINNPLKIDKIKYDSENRPSFKVIGEKSTININPENGNMITAHKTHSKLIKKLKGNTNEDKVK